jgi:multiple sugar transport system substrate-binding protein
MIRRKWLAAGAAAILMAAAGCGDDGGDSSGGGGSGGGEAIENAKQIDVGSMEGAKGEITYCQGKDTTGETKAWGKQFNDKYKSQGLSVKLVEFPASADEQRTQFVQRQEAKAGDCDVFRSDVIWTAEFASQGWLYDLTPYIEDRRDEFIQPSIDTATYEGKIWGVPHYTNAALLYYRKDKIDQAPATWQEVYKAAADQGGIVYQGAAYEGLTCDFLELAFAAGGKVVSDDGTKAEIDSPQNVKALQLMVDGVKSGAAPKAVTTYMEPESLAAWQTGKYAFMRNWPYAYALSVKDSDLKGKFKAVPQPSFEGGGKAGILGGHNSVISIYSKNPGAALAAVDYNTSLENNIRVGSEFTLAPVLTKAYDDAKVKEALPFSDELKQAVAQAKARPVSPVYPQISQAIYNNVNDALAGRTSPADAMKKAQSEIEKALATF